MKMKLIFVAYFLTTSINAADSPAQLSQKNLSDEEITIGLIDSLQKGLLKPIGNNLIKFVHENKTSIKDPDNKYREETTYHPKTVGMSLTHTRLVLKTAEEKISAIVTANSEEYPLDKVFYAQYDRKEFGSTQNQLIYALFELNLILKSNPPSLSRTFYEALMNSPFDDIKTAHKDIKKNFDLLHFYNRFISFTAIKLIEPPNAQRTPVAQSAPQETPAIQNDPDVAYPQICPPCPCEIL